MSHFLTDERITQRGALCFAIGFAGVVLLIGLDNLSRLGESAVVRELAALHSWRAGIDVGAAFDKRRSVLEFWHGPISR